MRNRILKRVITVIFLLLHTLEIFGANLVVDTEFLLLIYQLQMIEESVLMSLKNIILMRKDKY